MDDQSVEVIGSVATPVFTAASRDSAGVSPPDGLRSRDCCPGNPVSVGLAHRPAEHETDPPNGHLALSSVFSASHRPICAMDTRSAFGCGNGGVGLPDHTDDRIP